MCPIVFYCITSFLILIDRQFLGRVVTFQSDIEVRLAEYFSNLTQFNFVIQTMDNATEAEAGGIL